MVEFGSVCQLVEACRRVWQIVAGSIVFISHSSVSDSPDKQKNNRQAGAELCQAQTQLSCVDTESLCFLNCFELYLRIYRKDLLISRIKLH